MIAEQRVDPAWIKQQRVDGWPDMHPEDNCHRCGVRLDYGWFADRDTWLAGTAAWAAETGREGICCLNCFAAMHFEQTGRRVTWALAKWAP